MQVLSNPQRLKSSSLQAAAKDRPLVGIVLMVAAMLFIPMLDVCAKLLSADYHVLQVTWARYFFHFVALLILLSLRRQRWWRMPLSPKIQFLRGIFLLLSTLFFFTAITTTPIPNALALLFISPLIVTVLAPVILKENFDMRRIWTVIVGFIGVIIVLQPATTAFTATSLFALAAGLSYALYMLTTRKLSQERTPLLTLFYTGVIGVSIMSFIVPTVWIMPDLKGWALMALMGVIAAIGHFLIIRSLDFVAASLVAPFNYVEILGATLISYLFFDYLPSPIIWLGISIIVGSGVYSSLKEYKNATPAKLKNAENK